MATVFFVTGSAGLVGYLQYRGALRKSIGDSGNVLLVADEGCNDVPAE